MTIVHLIRTNPPVTPPLPADAPDWVDLMTIGTWYEISGSSPDLGLSATPLASAIDPDPDNSEDYAGTGGFNSIWGAWSGAMYTPNLGDFGAIVHYGGGHRDGYSNAIPSFDLDTRTHSLLRQPSTAGPFSNGALLTDGCYIDGTPSPPHTYQYVLYDEVTNSLVCLKSIERINAPDQGSASLAIAQMLSLDSFSWRHSQRLTTFSSASSGCACVDTTRHVMWALNHTNGDFARFDPDVDNGDGTWGTWTLFAAPGVFSDDMAMQYDPSNDAIVISNFNTGNWWRKDPTNMSAERVQISITGLPDIADQSSLDYSSAFGGMIVHEAKTGDVYVVTSQDNWATASGSLLTQNTNGKSFAATNGFFSRSKTIQFGDKVVQVLERSSEVPVQAMRLA